MWRDVREPEILSSYTQKILRDYPVSRALTSTDFACKMHKGSQQYLVHPTGSFQVPTHSVSDHTPRMPATLQMSSRGGVGLWGPSSRNRMGSRKKDQS